MSSQLGFVIKFVVTTNCRKEQIQNAVRGVQAANVPTEKIKGEAVLKMTKRDDNLYVCDPFEGPAFKHLVSLGCRIVGAQCVVTCLEKDISLPKVNHPVHNLSLYGTIVTCSSIAKEKREWIHEKVQWMGGTVSKDLTECVTHLVAGEVGSKKYHVAADVKKPILLPDWVDACWEEGQVKYFNGTDQEVVTVYKCPVFKGCNVCVTGFQMDEKKNILKVITENGGIYSKELKFKESTHLIVGSAKGPKYEYAKKWKLHCVSLQWLHDGVEKGYSQDETLYPPEKSDGSPQRHTSTPVKDGSRKSVTTSKGFDISTISNISNLSSVDETAMTTFNITGVKGQAIPQSEGPVKVTLEDGLKALEELQLNQSSREPFLDGCKIYLSGFTTDLVEKLRRVINSGGGTRLSQLNEAVTHVLVGESVTQEVKRFHAKIAEAYILNVMWLIECYKTHQRQPESLYILPQFAKDDTLPKQIQQTAKVKAHPLVAADENTSESILNQYLPQAEVDKEDVTMVEDQLAGEEKGDDADETVMEPEVKGGIFADKIFTVAGFTSTDTEEIHSQIMDAQGKIVTEGSRAIPDFGVVPLEGCEVQRTVGEVVTICWLEMCLEAEKCLPTTENFLFKPVITKTTFKPLMGSVLSFSQYSAVEKEFLTQLASSLGAVCQDYFLRKPKKNLKGNTHLVLETPSGSKYDAAKKWNIPAVRKEWIFQCAKSGKKLPEESFLVDGATLPSDPVDLPPDPSLQASPEIPVVIDNLRANPLAMDVDVTPKEKHPQSDVFKTPNLGRLTLNSVKRPFSDSEDKSTKRRRRGEEEKGSMEETPSTPGRFLKSDQAFHPRFSFGGMDLQQTPASDTDKRTHRRKSSLPQEVFLYQNLSTAVQNTKDGNDGEEQEEGNKSIFEKDSAKGTETDILHGLVICISKSLTTSHGNLNKIVQCLGGSLQWSLDTSCTHYVFQGKANSTNKEYRKARKIGVCIVSPEWLYACKEASRRLDEKLYPHTVNPNMSLSLSQAPVNDSVLTSHKASTSPAQVTPVSPQPPCEAEEGGFGNDLSMEEEQLMIAQADAIEDKENSGSTDEQREEFQRQFAQIMATSGNSDSAKRRSRRQLRSSNGKDGNNTEMGSRRSSRRLTRSRRESSMTSPVSKKNSEDNDSETCDKCVITWDDDTSRVCRENAIARLRREDVKNDDISKQEEEDEDQRKAAVKEFTEQGNFQSANPTDGSPSFTKSPPPIRLPSAKPAVAPQPVDENQCQKDSPSKKKVFLFTGLTEQERIDYGALIEQLGGEAADKPYYNTNCTHMIVGSPTRNEKYLAAIASGRWILHRSYMVECQKARRFIEEEPHELNSSMFTQRMSSSSLSLCDAPKRWREQLQSEEKGHKGAFDGWQVLLLVDEKREAGLKRILEAGCGTVLSTRCPFPASALNEATHLFLNSTKVKIPKGSIDLEAIVSSGTLCLRPDYIADFLIKVPTPDPSQYLLAEVKPILERLANDATQPSESTTQKRKTRESSSSSISGSTRSRRR